MKEEENTVLGAFELYKIPMLTWTKRRRRRKRRKTRERRDPSSQKARVHLAYL